MLGFLPKAVVRVTGGAAVPGTPPRVPLVPPDRKGVPSVDQLPGPQLSLAGWLVLPAQTLLSSVEDPLVPTWPRTHETRTTQFMFKISRLLFKGIHTRPVKGECSIGLFYIPYQNHATTFTFLSL